MDKNRRRQGDFNPRSRTGSDAVHLRENNRDWISIHAPAQGATFSPGNFCNFKVISIHAPAQGATRPSCWRRKSDTYFNPRSRTGSDPRVVFMVLPATDISIHAPAQGATGVGFDDAYFADIFQSTLPHRERPWRSLENKEANMISIHAPAQGATLSEKSISDAIKHFNPRSRTGSDPPVSPRQTKRQISIHAPAQGATKLQMP